MTFKSFLKECNEKEVLKMLSIYVVSSWVLIQVLAVTWDPLGLPKISVTWLILLLLLGLPFYIYYIWVQKLAPLEAEKTIRISKKGKPKKSGFYKMYFTVLSVVTGLCIVVAAFIVENNFLKGTSLPKHESTDKIAILKFGNNTGDKANDIIGKMTSDWIMHGITQYQLGQVVSPEILSDYLGILEKPDADEENKEVLNKYFKPAKVIVGNYYLVKDDLLFQCSIMDGAYDETYISFEPIKCDKEDPLVCIESLKQKILGYLITEVNPAVSLEETPPKFEAYQYFIDAEATFGNDEAYIDLLNKAIAADSNYFEPKVMRVAYYYNKGAFRKADSLRRSIVPNSRSSDRQSNLLATYNALLEGNNRLIYKHTMYEYKFAPFHILTNAGAMVVALQYVNKPKEVDSIFKAVSMEGMNLESCTQCKYRIYTQALADIELQKYDQAIKVLQPVTDVVDDLYLQRGLMAAYIRSNRISELESQLNRLKVSNSEDYIQNAQLYVAKEFLLQNNLEKSNQYLDKVLSHQSTLGANQRAAEALYYKDDYSASEAIFEELRTNNPEDVTIMARLAVCYKLNGKKKQAQELLDKLDSSRGKYQFGSVDYAIAQYYAKTGNKAQALQYLLKSIASGNTYTPMSFQNDPHFIVYRGDPEFKKIMTFWH
jgi:tetratricopeptide (TPR) repeat protein